MVDTARYFIDFLTDESCGKCTPCREGLRQMHKLLTCITEGKGKEGDIELLIALSEAACEASLCALGKSAPNPFLSTLKYFRDEYEAHIREKRCPALSCKALISYYIDPEKCTGCMACVKKCPANAIDGGKKLVSIIDQEKCTRCGTCLDVCPTGFSAVKRISGSPVAAPVTHENRGVKVSGK
jgi:NADH-quinone oxidoreductase subunit F